MEINSHKIKLNTVTAELPDKLDENLRTWILTETDIYAVESRDNQDGTKDVIYKCKTVGSTEVRQGEKKLLAKSKRTNSQKLRAAFWHLNPDDNFYDIQMNKIIYNLEEIIEFIKEK